MLERSPRLPHATRIERRIFGGYADESLVRRMGDKEKQWSFSIGFGGSSNCWWGCTPRLHPSDFRLRSLYGVGRDWPIMEQDIMDKFLTATDFLRAHRHLAGEFPWCGRSIPMRLDVRNPVAITS